MISSLLAKILLAVVIAIAVHSLVSTCFHGLGSTLDQAQHAAMGWK